MAPVVDDPEGGLEEEPTNHSTVGIKGRLEDVLINLLYKLTSVKNWAYAFCCVYTVLGVMYMPQFSNMWLETWKWITGFYFGANVVQKFTDSARNIFKKEKTNVRSEK